MYSNTQIIGNLGRDPELAYLSDGTAVARFSVATSDYKKNTIWYRVSVFGKSGEACNQYLRKGSKVFVTGSLQGDPNTGGPRLWSKQDGSLAASFEIRANDVKFLSSRNESDGGGSQVTAGGASASEEGDIPF